MDHATAVRQATAEAYILGELGEAERDAFEEHFFTCPECAEEVKALSVFVEDARAVLAREPAHRRLASAVRRLFPGPWRPMTALPLAATVLLLLGVTVYQSAVTVPRLQHELAEARAPQATSWHFLTVARGNPPEVRVTGDHRMIGVTLSRSGYEANAFYRVDVRDATGKAVQSSVVPAPPAGDELQLLIPAADLDPGTYTLVLSGLNAPDGPVTESDLVRYPFILTREDS